MTSILVEPAVVKPGCKVRCQHCRRLGRYSSRLHLVAVAADDPFSRLEWWCGSCCATLTGIPSRVLHARATLALPLKSRASKLKRMEREANVT